MGKKFSFLLFVILCVSLFLFVPKSDNTDKVEKRNEILSQKFSMYEEEKRFFEAEKVNTYTSEKVKTTIQKRKEYGLSTDEKTIKKLVDNGDYSDVWGFHMTKEEEKEIWEKGDKNSEFTPKIKEEMKQDNDLKNAYSDMYIDWKKGGVIVVVLKENTFNDNKEKLNKMKEKYNEVEIEFKEMKYNEWQLSQMVNVVVDNKDKIEIEGIDIVSMYSDLISQKIKIGVYKEQLDEKLVKEKISKVTKIDKSMLEIYWTDQRFKTPY